MKDYLVTAEPQFEYRDRYYSLVMVAHANSKKKALEKFKAQQNARYAGLYETPKIQPVTPDKMVAL